MRALNKLCGTISFSLSSVLVTVIFLAYALMPCSQCHAMKPLRFGWYNGGEFVATKTVAVDLCKYFETILHVTVKAVKVKGPDALVAMIKAGDLDFTILPNYKYRAAASHCRILATPEINGSRYMQLYVIVPASSNIMTLRQLKGRMAAKPNGNCRLHCSYLATAIRGDPRGYFSRIKMYRTLRESIYSVAQGKTDASCVSSDIYNLLVKFDPSLARNLRIIKKSSAYPLHPVVASMKLGEKELKDISSVLLYMNHDYSAQNILMIMGIQGFGEPVTDTLLYPSYSRFSRHSAKPGKTVRQKKKVLNAVKTVKSVIKSEQEKQTAVVIPAVHLQKKIQKIEKHKVPVSEVNASAGVVPGSGVSAVNASTNDRAGRIKILTSGKNVTVSSREPTKNVQNMVTHKKQMDHKVGSFNSTAHAGAVLDVGPAGHEQGTKKFFDFDHLDFLPDMPDMPSMSIMGKRLPLEYLPLFGMCTGFLLIGVFMFYLIRHFMRRQELTVIGRLRDGLVTMNCIMNSERDIEFRSCDVSEFPEETDCVDVVHSRLKEAGHKKGMRLIGIIPSDRVRLTYYSIPFMPEKEIVSALEWKLKDDNIPYSSDLDLLQYLIIDRNRKQKKITMLTQVFPKEHTGWILSDPEYVPDILMSPEACLLHCMNSLIDKNTGRRSALVYRLNQDEALIVIQDYGRAIFSRRLYAMPVEGEDKAQDGSASVIDNWNPFAMDIRQTLRFYRDKVGPVDVLFITGEGVLAEPDKDETLSGVLEIKIKGLDIFEAISDMTSTLDRCPQPEIIIGAARAWFSSRR